MPRKPGIAVAGTIIGIVGGVIGHQIEAAGKHRAWRARSAGPRWGMRSMQIDRLPHPRPLDNGSHQTLSAGYRLPRR
jgi:hypothetical protein